MGCGRWRSNWPYYRRRKHWNTQTNPDTQNRSLYSVFFLDSDNGWAVGNGGIILQTTNGGTTWTIEGAGLTTAFLRGVHFTSYKWLCGWKWKNPVKIW